MCTGNGVVAPGEKRFQVDIVVRGVGSFVLVSDGNPRPAGGGVFVVTSLVHIGFEGFVYQYAFVDVGGAVVEAQVGAICCVIDAGDDSVGSFAGRPIGELISIRIVFHVEGSVDVDEIHEPVFFVDFKYKF